MGTNHLRGVHVARHQSVQLVVLCAGAFAILLIHLVDLSLALWALLGVFCIAPMLMISGTNFQVIWEVVG